MSNGGASNTSGTSSSPTVAVYASGSAVVAWQEGVSNYDIYVARFDGTTWQAVGASGTSGGGVSNNAGRSRLPSVAAV